MSKKILITGSTDGIGRLVAIQFAKEGQQLLLHGRSPEKLQQLLADIKSEVKDADVESYVADFGDFEAVKKMAQSIEQKHDQLDVLINNAGVFRSMLSSNDSGMDIRMAVNYYAPYILTHALIPLLEKSEGARIINLSSAAQASISEALLTGKQQGPERDAYAQSKLAITMWSFYLAKKHPQLNVIAVNPGSLLNTKMAREAFGNFWSPAEKGSDILYELALSPSLQQASGKYFNNDTGAFEKAHPDAYKDEEVAKLIRLTEQILADMK